MVTLVGCLKRKPGLTREEFQKWWVEKHVPFVKQVPGLRRYVVHVTQKGFDPLAGPSGTFSDEPPFEGIAELWFDDEAAVARAWSSPEGMKDLVHIAEIPATHMVAICDPKVMISGPQEPFPIG